MVDGLQTEHGVLKEHSCPSDLSCSKLAHQNPYTISYAGSTCLHYIDPENGTQGFGALRRLHLK
jgi:hypothetical protein